MHFPEAFFRSLVTDIAATSTCNIEAQLSCCANLCLQHELLEREFVGRPRKTSFWLTSQQE